MKKMLSYAIVSVSALAITAGATIPANAAKVNNKNAKVYTYVCTQSACSELNSNDLQSVLEECSYTLNCEQNAITPPVDTENEDTTEPDSENNSEEQESANDSSISEYERKVAELVNEIRVENGLFPLVLNSELSTVARVKSQDMKDNQYFNHTSPVY